MLLNYFNGTAISISLVLPAAGVLPVIVILNLDDSESGTTINFPIFFHGYCSVLLDYKSASQKSSLSYYQLVYYWLALYSQWMMNTFWMLLVYFFHVLLVLLHFLLLQWLLWFPLQGFTHYCGHKSLNSALQSWFDYLQCILYVHNITVRNCLCWI